MKVTLNKSNNETEKISQENHFPPSPVVGSSRKRSAGRVRSSVAMESLRFSPPEMPLDSPPPTRESRTSVRPSSSRIWGQR